MNAMPSTLGGIATDAADQSLCCVICKEIYSNPVQLKTCQHTFCSLCIRNCFARQMNSIKRAAKCPVCNHAVDPAMNFGNCLVKNIELAKAVESQTKKSPPTKKQPSHNRRLVLRRPLFKGMKKPALQSLCQEVGLPVHGRDVDLINRYKELLALDDAESDALNPRPTSDLVAIVIQRERRREEESFCNSGTTSQQTQVVDALFRERNGEASDASILQSLVASQMSERFRDMIKKERERRVLAKNRGLPNAANTSEATSSKAVEVSNDSSVPFVTSESSDSTQGNSIGLEPHAEMSSTGGAKANAVPVAAKADEDCNTSITNTRDADNASVPVAARAEEDCNNSITNTCDAVNASLAAVDEKDVSRSSPGQPVKPTGDTFNNASPTSVSDGPEVSVVGVSKVADSKKSSADHVSKPASRKRKGKSTLSTPAARKQAVYPLVPDSSTDLAAPQFGAKSESPSIIGPWSCAVCTFRNLLYTSSRAKCEMCESPRPCTFTSSGLR